MAATRTGHRNITDEDPLKFQSKKRETRFESSLTRFARVDELQEEEDGVARDAVEDEDGALVAGVPHVGPEERLLQDGARHRQHALKFRGLDHDEGLGG